MTKSQPEPDLSRWVADLQQGIAIEDNSRRIFELFYPRILSFFANRGLTHHDAEDLTQSVFLQLFTRILSYQGEGSFESWLFAIAANRLRNEERYRKREKRLGIELPIETSPTDDKLVPTELPDQQPLPEQAVFERQRQTALLEAIEALPPQMQTCLRLRFDQGLKYREIAVLLQVSIETVKVHLYQARQRLGEKLGKAFTTWES